MAIVDPQGRLLEANPAFWALLDPVAQGPPAAMSLRALLGEDDAPDPLIGMGAGNGPEGRQIERHLRRPDGVEVVVRLHLSAAAATPEHRVLYVVHALDDTDGWRAREDLRRYDQHLRDLARRDPLTGLLTRRELQWEIDEALATGDAFTVVLLALEHPAGPMSARGQVAGDDVLRTARASLAALDDGRLVIARSGAAQVAVLARGVDDHGAGGLAERVADALERDRPELQVIWGTASHPEAGTKRELLLLRAEMALHGARPRDEQAPGATASGDWRDSIERLLALVRQELGTELCYLTHVEGERQRYEVLSGDAQAFGVAPGDVVALHESFCGRMLDGRLTTVVADAASHPVTKALSARERMGIGAWAGVPVRRADGRLFGTLCGIDRRARPDLGAGAVPVLRLAATLMAERLEHEERESARRRTEVELSGLHALLAALAARDHYTSEHSRSVVTLAAGVARRLGLGEGAVADVRQVATLHDVGKVGMPDSILQKRGPLDAQELALMRQHPVVGARILEASSSLKPFAVAVRAEHERWDGQGYPDRLTGSQIPLASRITLACDAYDAMTSDRPYRAAMGGDAARAELEAHAGTQFDPRVIAALLAELRGDPPAGSLLADAELEGSVLLGRTAAGWRPLTPVGRGAAVGEVRAACQVCGSHLTAMLSRSNLVGSCPNCGSYEIELVAD